MTKMTKMNKSRKVRESIKKQIAYKQNYKCFECNNMLPPSYQIDHIIPHAISFDDSITNLNAMCPNCHANKSQKETMRIIQYKNMKSNFQGNYNICWFCLETYEMEHDCNKICKDIDITLKKQNELVSSFVDLLSKYKYTNIKNIENLTEKLENCKINDILYIKLSKVYIYVNNYIYRHKGNIDINEIIDAVFVATRSKKESFRYSTVNIQLLLDGTDEENNNCIDYLYENIVNKFPDRIFKKNTVIDYIFC